MAVWVVSQFECNRKHRHSGAARRAEPESMNTSFSKAFGACVPGFRARGLCPRPGMTMLQFKLRHYRRLSYVERVCGAAMDVRVGRCRGARCPDEVGEPDLNAHRVG